MIPLLVLLAVATTAQDIDCQGPLRPAFVRVPGALKAPPVVVAKLDMVTCASLCRRNAHPASETSLPCRGFNFRVGRAPSCEFLDPSSPISTVEPRPQSFYFEKTCLAIPPRCEEAAFVVDTRRGVRLQASSEMRLAMSQKECTEACFSEDCAAFEWSEKNKTCRMYSKTRREHEAIRADGVLYMENNCIAPSFRCPSERVDFLLARRSDVASFGVSVGVRSIRACMHECVDTALFHCRSFQFDPVSSECFVSDESSEEAVPSSSLDLYEPFCSPPSVEPSCNRPYAYEKILTTKMVGATELAKEVGIGPEKCLATCSIHPGCRAANYDVNNRICHLLDRQRPQATIGPDENYDFYENACPPPANSHETLHPGEGFHLVARDKTLSFRLRHAVVEVRSPIECHSKCRNSDFLCRSFAFSSSMQRCTLSATVLNGADQQMEEEAGGEVYAVNEIQSRDNKVEPESTTQFPTLVSVSAQLETSAEQNIFTMTEEEFAKTTEAEAMAATVGRQPDTTTTTSSTTTSITTEKTSTTTATAVSPARLKLLEGHSLEQKFGLLEVGAVPRLTDEGHVPPSEISVEAQCFDNGVNVTFEVSGEDYTGALYATERFEQCRVLVRGARRFAIFIPRPSHNTVCNALEADGVMSTVLVLSNDRVWPLDVTTADDLFYHISCNYSQAETLHRGIVVGGPSPMAVAPEAVKHSISLQITRKGKPVSNVYIGETLTARVDSNLPASDLRVVDCTAHRAGSPNGSLHLIADGCALLPSLMTSMILSPRGWEATLSAFRVDDSEQVDIACMVSVCAPGKCNPHGSSCPPAPRSARSLVDTDAVRIDTRLSVHGNSTEPLRNRLPDICVQPSVYLSVLLLLILLSMAATCSLVSALRARKARETHLNEAL